jgi:ribosomal protein S18 acetylase RimI-like enzyme
MEATTISLPGGAHATIAHPLESDAGAVIAYFELVAGETDFLSFGAGELGRTIEDEASDIRALANPSRGLMLMAKVGVEIAGIVTIHRFARSRVHHRGELGVSVQQKFWGLGIGRALCEAAILEARHIGLTRIDLHTRHDNARAIALYENLGFQLEGRIRAAFRVGELLHDDLAMGLRLHPEH